MKYAKQRDRLCLLSRTDAFLVSERGQRLDGCIARRTFARISCAAGVRPATGSRRIGHGPRLQDFRHCFATRKLIEWYRAGLDVERELPKLAMYWGMWMSPHLLVSRAVPELLQLATDRLGAHGPGDEQ